jgi:lipopolysaccharide transport system permease protein
MNWIVNYFNNIKYFFSHQFLEAAFELFAGLFHNRKLIISLVWHEIQSKYKGSVLGFFWSIIYPLCNLLGYTFVFTVVFKYKWSIASGSKVEFALLSFIGMSIFNVFSETLTRASTLIVNNSNYVKKVIFPLEILPVVSILSNFFQFIISFLVWFIFYILFVGKIKLSALFFPFILLPLILLTLGFAWVISALGVYFRDSGYITSVILTMTMFLSPIFYPISAIPEEYHFIVILNPLAQLIEMSRQNLIFDQLPNLGLYLIQLSISFITLILGFIFFKQVEKGFADVL